MVYVFRTFFGFTWIFCWLYLHVAVISPVVANPIEGDVRLVDGGADNQGRIEIYYNDTWWALCQSHFNHDAFNTVCKKLSLPEPHEQFHESQFGPGNQSILPMDFSCDGHESSLMDCRHEDFYSHHCGAHNTVGVSCGELVMKDCGGDRMDIFGKLNFLRGPKPNERECKWTLGNAGNPEGYQVIVNTYYDSEDCGSQVRMREPMEDHDFNHDDLCGDNRFRIYEFPKSRITLTVEQHHSDEDVPFDGAYAISNGRMDDALQVSGWDVTTINKTERSVHVQWPQLSSEIDKAVRAYIVVAAFQHHGEKHGRIVSSDNSSVEILGLSPFKEYQITVFALDEASQLHKSNEISVTTDEGVPRSPPNYHGYMIDEAGCVRLHWDPIAEHDRNGLILGYIITYIADCFDNPDDHDYTGNTTVSSSSNSATLCQLRPGSKYSIGLSGYTSKGIGPYRHDTIYAGCGQERVLTEINGTISSPNKPCPYGGYQSCMWSINPSANTPKAIWMRFTEFRLRYDHDHDQDTSCRSHDWVGLTTVGDGSGVLLCRHLDHFTVLVTDSHVDMSFSTRRREEGDGFYVSYEGVQNDFTATQLSSWNVSVEIQMFSADITWADYPHGDPIQEMFVMYTQTNDNITVMLPVEQLDSTEYHMESILLADRVYIFQVCAFTGGIEDAIYCSQNVTIRTMERAPEEAPHNVRLERLLNNEILVTWYPLSDMQANGQVRRYTVHYREWQDHYQWHEDWEQVMSINVSSSEDHHVLSGLDGGRKYQIAVSAFTVGFGPPSEWQTIVIGCGGTFGGYFGRFNIRQWNWEALDCSWTIEKPQSIGSAVGRAIIFAANGSEVADVEDYECDQDIRGKILEIPFGETDLLTLKLHTEHDGSHFMAEFLILTEGYSAQPSPAQWDLTTSISDDGSVWIDFSGYSGSLDASFFSVLFNKTMSDRDYEDHHHDDENKEMFFLYSVNSSETSLKAFGLPVFTNFTTTGYVIEKDNDIYKSEELIVETGEGVPSEAPHIYDYHINDAGCVELNWNQISEEHRNGKIIGYVVSYETSCYSGEDDRSHSGYVNVSALSMSATICDLHSGLQYRVGVAGYTSVGMGHFNHRDDIFAVIVCSMCDETREEIWDETSACEDKQTADSCGFFEDISNCQSNCFRGSNFGCKEKLILTGSNGTIESPNRPCQYGGRQHCAWSIQPNNPTNEIWIDFEDSSRLEEYEYEMGCKANDRIAFTTNENVTEAYICREIRNYLIQITRSQVDVSFHARGEPHRRGEGFSAFYHASQESFFNITQLSSWNLTVTVDRISADIQWTSFPLGVSIGDMYLRFSVVDSNVYVLIPVNEADQSYHMRNLLMSGEIYVFDLVAVSSEDEGYAYSSLSVTVETEEGPPETAPESVNVELLTHDSVLVTWDPLPEEVSGYTVYFKHEHEGHDEQSVNVSSSDSQRVLNSLEGGRSYQVSVAAFTIDWGPRSEWKTFMVGCGGSFHGYFGLFNLTQFDWNELHCTWTINNPGLANPVVYIAAHDVQLRSCEGSTKAYNSDHLEIWHHGGCSSVRGELAEIPFDGSSFLTLELQMKHEGSYVRSEYFILDGDKNLNSAVATAWEITHSITDDGRVLLDLSGFPANIDASYFIISMNKTKDNKEYHEEHHDYNEEDNGGWYLFAVNSSSTYFDIAGAPAFKNFTGVVYVVDTANEIFKSQEFQVQTGEGVPSESPHVEDIHIDENDCVEIKWNPIPEEHHNGIIRGYRISYYTECRSDDDPSSHSGHVDRPASDRYYKLCGLHTGLQYRVRVAGFTSKGAGHSEDREVFTSCGAPQTLTQSNGPINSPNKPCQYGGNQFCQWSIRPSSPTQAIWIKFWEFRLEEYVDSADCWSNDWVSISKGASGVASLMCRHVESFQVIVSSDQVDVGFYAKGEHHRRGDGFYAFYHAMDAVAEIHVPSWSFSANVDHLSVEFTWSSLSLGVHVDEYAVRFTQDGVSVMLPVGEHDGSRHWRNLLLPSRNYTFDVVAIAGKTIYSSQNVSAMTPEGAPGVAPPNVQAQVLPLNRILIMWDPIPSKYANGVLRGYKVYLREYRSHYEWSDDGELGEVYDVSLLETQLLLIGLDGGRKYQISAAACTVDVGPHSQWESLQVGCGGSFNGFFGAVDVTQWDWESRLDCSWTIGNNGVSNAFLLISAQEIDLHSCEDWVGVYASDGAELDRHVKCCHDHGECSDHVRGELRRVSFGNSDYLTLKVHTEHERSRVKSEFCVLEEGKDIDSALPSPSPWNVKTEILDEGGVLVNLTGDPANHDVSFYIIDMNKTQSQDDHYWGRVERYLHMVNASENLGRVTGIPVYSDYNAVVYRVDTSHDVYRSDEFYFQTPEGVPSEGPHHFEYKIMSRDSVYIEWSEISEEHHNGLLLGFSISYRPQCSDEGSSTQITIDLWTRSYTISGLLPATQYDISIAGYTAAGVGKRRHMDFTTSCGGLRTLTEVNGTVEGPNYPCRYRGPQYCRWTIQPSVQTKTIIMMFEDFRLDRDGDSYCSANDWLGISTGLFNNDTQFCGHHMDRFQLIITSSQVDLAFYAREHREGDSFSASYYSLDTDITKIQPPSWTMSVDSTESTKAHVSWVEFPLNDKNRDSFFLKIKEANKNISLLIPVEEWDRSRHIEGLYPNREYEVQVLLFTGPDFQHDIYSCQMVSFTTQQGAPSMAPLNVRMESKDGNSVSVSVDPLPISHHGGVLGGYYVYYTSDEHHYDPSNPGTKIELGPSETHTVIHGLEQMREYFIFASAFNEHGEGPRSQRQSIVLGCGGSFNQTFGELSLSKSDWDDRHCIWKIHDSGTENAFLLLSVHAMHFHHCGHEYAKVYSNDGELLSYTDCSEVRGEVFELAFGDSGVITIDILIQNMESYMWTEFVILKGGLQSAQPSPTPWNITGESMDRNIIVDWRSYPVDLNVSIFIISFNQTKMPEFEDHHHDEERKPLRILQVVNSSTTDFIIRDLPTAMEFAAVVYLVDSNNDIYKSERAIFMTEEGVPTEGPHLHNWRVNLDDRSFSFEIRPLNEESRGGILLGYTIIYAPLSDPNNTQTRVVAEDIQGVTLTNLNESETYYILIAGHTSKGVGKMRAFTATFCGGRIEENTALISSPNYPGTPFIAPDQHDDNPRCYWNIRPQSEVSAIFIKFNDFFLGRREDWGGCSGGIKLYFPDRSEHDDDNGIELCGRVPDVTVLVFGNVLDIKAWGFGNQRWDEEYRNGTRFQLDYEAVPGELTTVIGEEIDSWALTEITPSNVTCNLSWPEPPGDFLGGSSLEKYLIIYGGPWDDIYGTLTTYETQAMIEWLDPSKNYTVKVVAVLHDGRRGCIAWTDFETTEGVPATNPHIEWIKAIDYSTILLQWRPMKKTEVRGILRGYRVCIEQTEHHHESQPSYRKETFGPEQLEATITGLPSETEFRVWVAAFTAVGEGNPRHERWIRTKCGSPLHDGYGTIQSRGYPDKFQHGDCVWHIHTYNQSVLLSFEDFNIPHSHECRDFYVAVEDNSGMDPKPLCGDIGHFSVLVQAHRVSVLSHAESEQDYARGFRLNYLTLNNSVWEAELDPSWTLSISNPQSYSADAVWTQYSQQQDLFLYAVVCTPTLGEAGPTIATVDKGFNSSTVERLRPYTNYTAQVLALFKAASGEITFKGSLEVYIKTDEGVPSKPPENVEATAEVSTIHVSWQHIPQNDINGILIGYRIFYRMVGGEGDDEGENEQYSEWNVGPTDLQASIGNLSNSQTYRIFVAGVTKIGVGEVSEPVHARPGCEHTVHDRMRVVSSPGFPNNYPHETQCYWVFELDLPHYEVIVVIDTFHLETSDGGPNCTNWVTDFLGLFNIEPLYVAAGPFCGLKSSFAVTGRGSKHHRSVLYMQTNNGFAFKGFNGTYFVIAGESKITVSLDDIDIHEAQITWQISADAEQVQEYFVLYKPITEKEMWKFKKTTAQEATLVPLQSGIEYSIRVVGYSASEKVYSSAVIKFNTTGVLETTPTEFTPTTPPIDRMYPYGPGAGDTLITFDIKCFKVDIPNGGMRFFRNRHRKLYICPNGVIQFERDRIIQGGPYNFGQRPWLRYMAMLAPYWAPTHLRSFIDGPSKVYYHVYQGPADNATLDEATYDALNAEGIMLPQGKTFKATWAIVVTWQDLRHERLNDKTKNLYNTFQAVVMTDGIFSFAMANFNHGGIQFSAPTTRQYYELFSDYKRFPVFGWNAGDGSDRYWNHQRSGTIQIEEVDTLVGNAGIPGRYIARIEDSDGEEDGDLKCLRWFNREQNAHSGQDEPDPCPCTGIQAFFDERYEWVEPDFPSSYCFYTRFQSRGGTGRGRKCCYYTSREKFAALIIGFPGGGSLHRFHQLTPGFKQSHARSDVAGFRHCCLEARNPFMCDKYYELRPSEGCEKYEPPEWSWLWGDPHIVTLDGGNYTFNGLGEYTMVDVQDGMFQLQARTKLAKGQGQATVFVAAVAKEEQTSTVQANLKDEGGLEVLVDGEVYQNFSTLTNVSVMLSGSVAVSRPENNSFLMSFPSGISVTVTEIQGSLSIVFAAPSNFKNHTKGLLGTWNGDTSDDFLRPDGITLPYNSTGNETHFGFGLTWQVTSNTTLFTYNPGENVSTFADPSFVPIFVDDIQFANDTLRQQAEEICQGDVNCLFDIASTGDTAVGESTKQTSVQLESDSSDLQNFPPKILVGPTEINVTVNTMATVTVVAEDPNNDSLSFTVSGTLPAGYTKTSNDSSVTLSWSVTTTKIDIEFIVSDGSVNTVLRPVINVCACQNQGICTSLQEEDADNSDESNDTSRFNVLPCNCQNGYTGDFCDADLDACEENLQPCFPGVQCNDLPPPANETGFQCDPCPSGYSGDGIQCLDVDECAQNSDGCEHNCINTPGSFVCTCNSGYFLNLDKKTCQDIDECDPVSDCMHICENTMGSYNCKCNQDFKVDNTDPKKCVPQNPCEGQHGCQHVCFSSDGQDKCSCNAGYALDQDGKSCSDIDECATNQHRCTQGCKNSVGSYSCSCVDGFILDSDGYNCNDVDECLEWTFNCTDASQKCENTYGSYKCVCDEGLYWIDNMCKGLEKGQAPPPPPTAPPPRAPSDEERSEAVQMILSC